MVGLGGDAHVGEGVYAESPLLVEKLEAGEEPSEFDVGHGDAVGHYAVAHYAA